jgi:hypothetical protein
MSLEYTLHFLLNKVGCLIFLKVDFIFIYDLD